MKLKIVLIVAILAIASVQADPTVQEEQDCVDLNVMQTCPYGESECQQALFQWEQDFAKNNECNDAQKQLDKLSGSDYFPSKAFVKCYQEIHKENKNSQLFNLYFYNPTVNCASNATPYSQKSKDSQYTLNDVLTCEVNNAEVCLAKKPSLSFKGDVAKFEEYFESGCRQQKVTLKELFDEKSYGSIYPFDVRSCNASIAFIGDNDDFNQMVDCKMKCANPGNETGANILIFSSFVIMVLFSLL